jgi:hypothetical protein
MSQHDEEQGKGVKVVDRRRFDEDGSERPEDARPAEVQPPAPAPPAASAEEATASPMLDDDGVPPLIDFATFVQSLAQQALMHLGVLPHPETGERMRELGLARQTIDILDMLHQKTRGNLSHDEKRLFDAILHDLRLVYVQVAQPKP